MALEQLRQAESFKEEGNHQHREGNYRKALGCYHKVFCFVNGLVAPQNQDVAKPAENHIPAEKVEEVKRLKQTTRLNMAACYLKLGENQKCVDACTAALDFGPHAKAYFRRAQAYVELRNFSDAGADLDRAGALEPKDQAIQQQIHQVRRSMRRGDAEKAFGGIFEAPAGEAQAKEEKAVEKKEETEEEKEEKVEEKKEEAKQPQEKKDEKEEKEEEAPIDPLLVPDEAKKFETQVRELSYAWQQTDEEVKVYIPFDQSEELSNLQESQVSAEFGEWSISVVISVGAVPFGLRLGDLHRRLAPEKCRCSLRASRVTLKLVKREKEHWWNLLQKSAS
ncbi:unnamed protein product [Effrenium voratum]|nr:unnamed protein product [Effrenium voratum]